MIIVVDIDDLWQPVRPMRIDHNHTLLIADSIATIGMQVPIIIRNGKIIDGLHRVLAMQLLGFPCIEAMER